MQKSKVGSRAQRGYIYSVKIGDCHIYLSTRCQPDDQDALESIDIYAAKVGSTLYGLLKTLSVGFNAALQNKGLEGVLMEYVGERYEPYGQTNDPDIPTCESIGDYIAKRLARDYLGKELNATL